LYLDEESHLLLQLKTESATAQGPVQVVSKMSDYRKIDGLMLAFSIKVEAGPSGFNMTVKEIKQNVPMEDALFAKPAK
jgi:hypothetical protein